MLDNLFMATEDVQTNLRIPGDLKDRLMASAEAGGRSLSGEVAYRVARAYQLEVHSDELEAEVAVARNQIERLHFEVERWRAECQQARHELAAVYAKLEVLQHSKESDIAAATNLLSERVDFLAARAGAAEREAMGLSEALRSQKIMVRALAQFIVTQGKLSSPEPGTEEIHEHMQETARAVTGGDSVTAMQAVIALTPLLNAYVDRKSQEATDVKAAKKIGRKSKP